MAKGRDDDAKPNPTAFRIDCDVSTKRGRERLKRDIGAMHRLAAVERHEQAADDVLVALAALFIRAE